MFGRSRDDSASRLNIAVVGDSGVGKSSLVNAIFGEPRAVTGIGAPVTHRPDYYVHGNGAFGIWDFPGFEHGTNTPAFAALMKGLRTNRRGDTVERIDIAWFCWDGSTTRLTDGQRALVRAFSRHGVPVMAVMTKVLAPAGATAPALSRPQREFARHLAESGLDFATERVFPTAAVRDPEFGLETYGLRELLVATLQLGLSEPQR